MNIEDKQKAMLADDLLAYIKNGHTLEECKAYINGYNDAITKLRTINVLQQSEQLKAFAQFAGVRMWEDQDKDLEEFVDEFLRKQLTKMNFKTLFANCQKEKLEINYGYFVHWHHDLYGGLAYFGVFESKEKAEEYANKQKGYDRIHVLFLPYVKFDGKTFALWCESACS